MAKQNESSITLTVDDRTQAGLDSARKGFRDFTSAVGVLEGPLNGVTGRMSYLNTLMARVSIEMVAAGVAAAGLSSALVTSVQNGLEYEKQLTVIQNLLNATSYASGQTAQSISDMADRIAEATLASAQGVREAAAALLTYRTISGETFEQVLRLGQDSVAVFGGDLRSAVNAFGKALENPAVGLSSLSEKGITFDSVQKRLILSASEAGDYLEAQRLILQAIADQIGGAGDAKGTAAAIDSLSGAWETLTRTIGNSAVVKGTIEFFTTELKETIQGIQLLYEKIFGKVEGEDPAIAKTKAKIEQAKISNQKIEEYLEQSLEKRQQLELKAADKEIENLRKLMTVRRSLQQEEEMTNATANADLHGILFAQEYQSAEAMHAMRKDYILKNIDDNTWRSNLLGQNDHILSMQLERTERDRSRFIRESAIQTASNVAESFSNIASVFANQSKSAFNVYKKFMQSVAIIDALGAFNKALNDPTPTPMWLRWSQAGLALTAGLAKAHQINQMSPSGGSASGGGAGGGGATAPTQYIQPPQRNDVTVVINLDGQKITEYTTQGVVKSLRSDGLVLETENGRERVVPVG